MHGVRSDVGTGDNLPTAAAPVLDEGLGRAVGIYVLGVEAHGQDVVRSQRGHAGEHVFSRT